MNKQELIDRIAKEWINAESVIRAVDLEGWLHDPDQIPGRTITESEFNGRTSLCSELETHWFKVGYLAAGGNIVSDPEPKPTIEFARDIMRFESGDPDTRDIPHWAVNMAAYLMDAGYVKAPGGDDEC